MPRFKFNFQRVLDIRATQEQVKQNELALEIKKEQEILQKISQFRLTQSEEYQRGQALLTSSTGNIRLFVAHQRYMEALERMIDRGYQDLDAQRKSVETARQALIEASRKRKLLEKLKDKRFAAFKKEEETAEQKNIDEIGGIASARRMARPSADTGMEAGR